MFSKRGEKRKRSRRTVKKKMKWSILWRKRKRKKKTSHPPKSGVEVGREGTGSDRIHTFIIIIVVVVRTES